MSTSDNYFAVGDNIGIKSEPSLKNEMGNMKERNIEHFLNRLEDKNPKVNEEDVDNDSITINEDIHSISKMSFLGEEKKDVEIVDIHSPLSVDITKTAISEVKTNEVSEHSKRSKKTEDEHILMADYPNPVININVNRQYVATPTIITRRIPLNIDGYYGDKSQRNSSEVQIFNDQLNQLSTTIQQKDEEIQKLSNKVFELESRTVKNKNKSCKKLSSSSDESEAISNKIKKKKGTKSEKKSISKKDENLKSKEIADRNNSRNYFEDNKSKESIPISNHCNVKNNEKIVPNLRHKLNELEAEVKRLKQVNIESMTSIQGIQRKSLNKEDSNNTAIKQLLVDYNHLKEELDLLRLKHTKLTESDLLLEKMKELKQEVDTLRTQNKFLHQYVKSSAKSLNKDIYSSRHLFEDNNENFKELRRKKKKTSNYNNISKYNYERLNSRQSSSPGARNVSPMYRHSMESPHRISCQSIQNVVPLSVGKTYRARRLSDSSSVFMEDVSPKIWLKPAIIKYNSKYNNLSRNNKETPRKKCYQYDEGSTYSTVSCTTSELETEKDWKYTVHHQKGEDESLLSTDSDTFGKVTDHEDYKRKLRYSYAFSPKSDMDLNLEDLVKFARPGGKMSTGRVCFVGHLCCRSEVCVGLELDEDAGRHDGVFEGVRYFQCKKNRGVFISFHKIILAYKSI